ncbi:MAG TPA: DNA-3-methyladenine glycosylase [Gemmatimonadaceae bacterium]|jgi:DNA-3-methyladenine glycosylase|nr:DNA-3-methyladenine glycosylase [Gemmatimonadaceae bacterium]
MTENAARTARRSRIAAHQRPLPRSFYDRDTELVARELLGAVLWCASPDGVAAGRIVETEAYLGEHDGACHAVAGLTQRTRWLYGPPGIAYVYFIYGVHWCFNAVTRREGLPSAVLVRALEPVDGLPLMRRRRGDPAHDRNLTNGPGKLCAALAITGAFSGARLDRPPLSILRGNEIPDADVGVSTRIGITRAADWPLRWYIKENPFVSRAPRVAPRRPRAHAR